MTKSRREKVIEQLKSYTPEDAKLSGLPDPARPAGSYDEADEILYQRFCHEMANDLEYWRDREERRAEELEAAKEPEPKPERLFTWIYGICHRIPGLISLAYFTRREK